MTFLLANWRLVLEAILAVVCAILFGLWQHSSATRAKVEAAGEYAKQEKQRIEAQYDKTFKEVQDGLEKAIPAIRAGAVDAYRKRYPVRVCNASQVPVPGAASGAQGADGAGGEQLATEPEFVRACANDALMLTKWQTWSRGNRLPVE